MAAASLHRNVLSQGSRAESAGGNDVAMRTEARIGVNVVDAIGTLAVVVRLDVGVSGPWSSLAALTLSIRIPRAMLCVPIVSCRSDPCSDDLSCALSVGCPTPREPCAKGNDTANRDPRKVHP